MRNQLPNYHPQITNQSPMSLFNYEETGKNLTNRIVRRRGKLFLNKKFGEI
jgi:hypothetical protein